MSHRFLSRKLALQTLFELDFQQYGIQRARDILEYNVEEFATELHDEGFSKELVDGVLAHKEDIDTYIRKYATEWPLEQITVIDRNILRLAIFEILFHPLIPARVAINESIELAKIYGGITSSKFVNGVLGSLYKDVLPAIKEKEDRLEKIQEGKKKTKEEGPHSEKR